MSELWKQALDICKKYNHLDADIDIDDAIKQIKNLHLNKTVEDKAIKILLRMNENHSVLDNTNLSNMLENIQATNDLVGQIIDDYKLISLIAKGGMSTIYKAQKIDTKIKKPVALKILSPYVYSDKSIELFKREQLILSQLLHPNIVSFHHSGETTDGTKYIIMEYIEGAKSIVEYSDINGFDNKKIVEYIQQLAKIFSYAHNNLIIHRDIKPSNILIDQQGNIKVIDFGIAQIISKTQSTSTQVFTLDSASPEQLLGENVTIQTDVFSLGAVLLQLLLKKEPLPKTNLTQYNPLDDTRYIKKLLKSSNLDTDLKNIIICASHIDLNKRYSNMGLFAQDLEHWLDKKPIHATADSKIYRAKKFMLRNPLAVSLSVFIFISMLIGLITIQNLASKAKEEIERANKTLDFLTHILDQTDSFQSNIANITLKQALDLSSDIPLYKLGGDVQLKKTLHLKLADIYYNMAQDDRAISQFNLALNIMKQKPQENKLEIIKTNLQKAQVSVGLGLLKQSTELSEKMLAVLESKFPRQDNLLALGYANLIKAFGQKHSGGLYNANKLQLYTPKLQKLIDQKKLSDLDVKLYALDVLAGLARNEKQYNLIEKYIRSSLKILEANQQQDSAPHYILKMNLGYNFIQQNKLDEAEKTMVDLISQIEEKDPNNYFLSRVYENYASLMFQKDNEQQSLKALTQALNISKNNQNTEGIYLSLSKRAMYYVRYNHFKSGLFDQLELLPILVHISGKDNPRTLSHLVNLALMLYSINQPELGKQVIDKSINLSDNISDNVRAIYHLIAGLSNWHANFKKAARQDLLNVKEYTDIKKNTKAQILQLLIDRDSTNAIIYNAPQKPEALDFYAKLLYLLQLNPQKSFTEHDLNELNNLCQLNQQFIKSKIISLKQIFLTTCSNLYNRSSHEIPDAISREILAISFAIKTAEQIPEKLIKTQVEAILKLVE